VEEKDRDAGLAAKIIAQETGAVLAWLLEGALAVSNLKELPRTSAHNEVMEEWRNANNSALQFINDTVACMRGKGRGPTHGSVLYRACINWATENGAKRLFGRNGFYEVLQEGGLVRVEIEHQPAFVDVCLRMPMDMPGV